MNTILEILKYTFPALIVGVVSYFLIHRFLKDGDSIRSFQIRKKIASDLLPSRLKAYERLALYLERIKPTALVRRVTTENHTKKSYEYALIKTIQDEWEHNLSQQIYINPETWKIIFSAKNATQNIIKQASDTLVEDDSVDAFINEIIKLSYQDNAPSNSALLKMQIDIQGGNS